MYESFYGLKRRPFCATPDADCFVATPDVDEALSALCHCVRSSRGIGVLTGAAGSGKTALCRRLQLELSDAFDGVYLGHCSFASRRSLLQSILYELNHPYSRMSEQELRLELQTVVQETHKRGRGVVLLVDEAHALDERVLEEIRRLADLSADGESLVRVVLSGQFALEEKLARSAMDALNQRIGSQVSLESFTRAETGLYVSRRIEWAGGTAEDVFTSEAVESIAHVSDGVPRCINQLCDHALLLGCVGEERPVGAAIVCEALDDLKQLPLHWSEPLAVISASSEESFEADEEFGEAHDTGVLEDGASWSDGAEEYSSGASIELGAESEVEGELVGTPLLREDESFDVAEPVAALEVGAAADRDDSLQVDLSSEPSLEASNEVESGAVVIEFGASDEETPAFEDGAVVEEAESERDAFVVEHVVDHYAALDTQSRHSAVGGIVWDFEVSAESATQERAEDAVGEIAELEDGEHSERALPPHESVIAGGCPSEPRFALIEEQIEEDVVQMAIDTQQAISERMAHGREAVRESASIDEGRPTDSAEPISQGMPRSREFDVVMPEAGEEVAGGEDVSVPDASETQERTFPGVGQSGEPRPYRRLFSDLRRRGMRETA
ncbi:MAG: hypothetical protein CMJ48_02825 [Planctomycetaceae bacterium]|nr:hypothetical protein [Planctomycetaceae bacterium]